uniref:Uncharacterized protein n=1 Tax=Sipha flava TaxID=143950 RepID=A0A2S2QZ91_9HEMI
MLFISRLSLCRRHHRSGVVTICAHGHNKNSTNNNNNNMYFTAGRRYNNHNNKYNDNTSIGGGVGGASCKDTARAGYVENRRPITIVGRPRGETIASMLYYS